MNIQQRLQQFWYQKLGRPYRLHISVEVGEGGRPLLLLHGLGSSGRMWQNLARRAAPHWYAVAPDLLGFGASPQPTWSDYSVDEHARAIARLINRQFGHQPVTLMAHSMGCLVAIRLGSMPEVNTSRLVLYEPPLLSAGEAKLLRRHRSGAAYQRLYGWVADSPQLVAAYSRLLARVISDSPFDVGPDNWLPMERTLRNTIMNQRAVSELKNMTVRTDIAYGRFDFIVDSRTGRRELSANPAIHFHRINAGHGVGQQSATELLCLLNRPASTEAPRR